MSTAKLQENLQTQEAREKIEDFFRGKKWKTMSRHQACEFFHETAETTHEMSRYKAVTSAAATANLMLDENDASGLYFHATMDKTAPRIILLQPELAADRRIFRKFGSHRFLHLNVSTDVRKEAVLNLLASDKPLWIAGRRYTFLWSKATKSPQCFVLFAEEGIGLDATVSAEVVKEWCIPSCLNPGLTLGKQQKRMKLSFSKTTASGTLPENCIETVPDITVNKVMTDGCGLISRDGLDFVWQSYKRKSTSSQDPLESEIEDPEESCPYSACQVRIGGIKGMLVLDESLGDGIHVQIRDSQLKYNLPMRSLKNQTPIDEMIFDDAYDTVDVCSWDEKPEKGFLNLRLIQLLEHLGVSLETLLPFVDKGLEWLEEVSASPFVHLQKREAAIVSQGRDEEGYDTHLLYRMAAAKINKNEPVFFTKLNNVLKKEAERMQRKVSGDSSVKAAISIEKTYASVVCENGRRGIP